MQKNCSNCGKDFHCGAARETGTEEFSCWCMELPHVGTVAASDQDCLCPDCLAQAIEAIKKLGRQESDESNRDQVFIVPASD